MSRSLGVPLFRQASNVGNWKADVANIASGSVAGDLVTVKNVRNTRYGAPGTDYQVVWETRTFDLSKLKRLWFIVEPFMPKVPAIAHTFLSFEFEDDAVCVSVEARTQVGQKYSVIKGMFNAFAVSYLFGDERDFILRRTNYLQHTLYMYPLITPPTEIRSLFLDMLATANALVTQPRFYNSVADNCTSSLKVQANRVRPGSFPPFMWAQVLPGRTDYVLYDKGWLATDVPKSALRHSYDIGTRARALKPDASFSKLLRAKLPVTGQA